MIQLVLSLIVTVSGWTVTVPRRPPVECRVMAYTNSIPPHVIYSPPGCGDRRRP